MHVDKEGGASEPLADERFVFALFDSTEQPTILAYATWDKAQAPKQ